MKTNLTRLLTAALLGVILAAGSLPTPVHAAEVKPYPLKICVVSGNKLGSMGKVVTKIYGDQEMKFCCKPCVKKFDTNPAKYLTKLEK